LHCLRRDVVRLVRGHPSRAKAIMVTLTNRGFHSILLYRLGHSLWKKGIPVFPMIFARLSQHLFAVDISYKARLGPGIVIVHGFGVVIGSDTEIAGDCCIFHGVTLGDRGSEWVNSDREDGHPRVGREVMFGAGAKVLGPIRIGDNSVIGANAVVLNDVPPNSVAAGIPAKVVSHRKPPHWMTEQETAALSPSFGTPGKQVAPITPSPGIPGEHVAPLSPSPSIPGEQVAPLSPSPGTTGEGRAGGL
jgi:serine O-acetyltransferase